MSDAITIHSENSASTLVPHISINVDEKTIENVSTVCGNAERLACQPMLKHEFVTPDMRTQRTTFGSGVTVEVNFDTDEVIIK